MREERAEDPDDRLDRLDRFERVDRAEDLESKDATEAWERDVSSLPRSSIAADDLEPGLGDRSTNEGGVD